MKIFLFKVENELGATQVLNYQGIAQMLMNLKLMHNECSLKSVLET